MNYEQKYKEALERAKKLKENPKAIFFEERNVHVSDYIFPELAESEDEKIRKAIINAFATHKDYEIFFGASVKDILAWLENQDERKDGEWSDEDEDKMILIEDRFSDYLDYVREDNSLTKYQKNSTKDEIVNLSNWLKSLRPQKHWKPSEEQMMKDAIDVEVKVDAGGYPYIDKTIELYDYDKDVPLAKAGEKVKVIIMKEEQL